MSAQHNNTAAIVAAKSGHLDIIEFLSERGADFDIQNEDGNTALIWAAGMGFVSIVRFLLSRGVLFNLQNKVWLEYHFSFSFVCFSGGEKGRKHSHHDGSHQRAERNRGAAC